MKTILWLLPVLMCGCITRLPGYVMPGVDDIRVVKPGMSGLRKFHVQELTFGLGNEPYEGTWIRDFVSEARRRGALYVSDIQIVTSSAEDNQPLVCITKVEPISNTDRHIQTVYTPGTRDTKLKPKTTTRSVTGTERKCGLVFSWVDQPQTHYTTKYDYMTGKSQMVQETRNVRTQKSDWKCTDVPTTKYVTESGYEMETEYTSAAVDSVTHYDTNWELNASDPDCHKVDSIQPNTISGKAYFPEKPEKRRGTQTSADNSATWP